MNKSINIKLKLALMLLFVLPSVKSFAQINTADFSKLKLYEDSLKTLGNNVINNENDLERKNSNYQFIKIFVNALKIHGSYQYKFDSVKTVSQIYAPDNRFRIFTWHVMNEDGSYRYYGTVQLNTTGALKMFPLTDFTPFIKNPEDSIYSTQQWFSAQYYKIIKTGTENPYYVLLGWKGNTVKTTKKVIDALSFKNDIPVFGLPVFEDHAKLKKRIVFEYSRQASMLLRYVPSQNLIVFDHLAPQDPKVKTDFSFYGPDLTYDGYQLKNGRWKLIQNLDMRNVPEERDANFVDPKKQLADSIQNVNKTLNRSFPAKNTHKKS